MFDVCSILGTKSMMSSEGGCIKHKYPINMTQELAMPASVERICTDAQPVLDPEAVERFCRVWAGVGRAILTRRSNQNG
jgi:hypothetical protein